jgi:hypothetical protein
VHKVLVVLKNQTSSILAKVDYLVVKEHVICNNSLIQRN